MTDIVAGVVIILCVIGWLELHRGLWEEWRRQRAVEQEARRIALQQREWRDGLLRVADMTFAIRASYSQMAEVFQRATDTMRDFEVQFKVVSEVSEVSDIAWAFGQMTEITEFLEDDDDPH